MLDAIDMLRLEQLYEQFEHSTHELSEALCHHADEATIRMLHEHLERAHQAWKEEARRVAHEPTRA